MEEEKFVISEILEPLHNCLREILARDEVKKNHLIEYTDADIVAIHLMYVHIMGNKFAHQSNREKIPIEVTTRIAQFYAHEIRGVTKGMTGLDIAEYYKKDREENDTV